MPSRIESNLMGFLACPDCQSDLTWSDESITCTRCERLFEIRNGIPILLPRDFDGSHLQTEEVLAELMAKPHISAQERFSESHWQESRTRFWNVVAQNMRSTPSALLNVGCGFDDSFRRFQDMGHIFVNFDIVYRMLDSLRLNRGARDCVVGDVNSLPFRKKTFDYLMSIDMLHHEVNRIEPLLRRFSDLLKPGGAFFLQDVNAWGMLQFPKSILMPKSVHRSLRAFYYHNMKHSDRGPADYEFPTNPFKVRGILEDLGFTSIEFFKNYSYPSSNMRSYRFYKSFAENDRVAKFHNYHYLLMAKKDN